MNKYDEKRPWGKFEQFCKNERCTVKIIEVNPGEQLSLQYHDKRDEFWKILSGKAVITIGDKTIRGKEEDEFFIPKGARHRITADTSQIKILEISFGDFDENDIIRTDDKYGRK